MGGERVLRRADEHDRFESFRAPSLGERLYTGRERFGRHCQPQRGVGRPRDLHHRAADHQARQQHHPPHTTASDARIA
jgi:hypothetical protein